VIDGISLHNWKSHEDSQFKFSKGTNILVGPMGSGKSTVLDALCFALFGNFPALQHKRLKLSDIIMSRPSKKEEAWVKVEFTWQGSRYTVERRINSEGSSEARVSKDSRLIQGPQPQRVNEEVERILRIDYELFTRAVYSEQNGIDYFLTLGRGDRKKQIDELLGISRFEVMRSNLSTVLNRIKGMQEDRRALLGSMDMEKLRREEELAADELKKLEREVAEIGAKASEVGSRRKSAEGSLSRMNLLEKVHTELVERKGAITRTIETLERDAANKMAGISPEEVGRAHESEIAKLEDELKDVRKLVAQHTKEIGSANEKIRVVEEELEERAELEKRMGESNESAEQLKADAEKKEKEVNEARGEIGCARRRISELDELIAELGKHLTKCPVCETPMGDEKRKELLERRKKERQAELEKTSGLEKLIADSEKLLSSTRERLKLLEETEDRLKKLRGIAELDRLKLTLKDAEEKLAREEGQVRGVESKKERMKVALEIGQARVRVEELRKEGAEVEKKLGELKFDRTSLDAKRAEVRELSVEESRLLERADGIRNEMKRVEELVKSKREEREKYDKLGEEIKRYGSLYENFVIFQNSVAETQKELREELIGAINSAMEEMWKTIYPYADYQGIRLDASEDDYVLQLNSGGSWVNVDGIASGGERSSASIAMRMAFSVVLVPNLSWLILDEPTHNLDEEGVRALGKVLNEYIPKIVEQVFVITHDEGLRDAASSVTYHLWRDKEKNEPTKVESVTF